MGHRKLEIFVFFESSYRYGAAARSALRRPCGSHFAKSRIVVLWGLTQIASHSRGNPSHHRASARTRVSLFRKIVFSCFFDPPIAPAPRLSFFMEARAALISQNAAMWYHRDSHKLRVIREGIPLTTVPRLGCAPCFLSKKNFLMLFRSSYRYGAAARLFS